MFGLLRQGKICSNTSQKGVRIVVQLGQQPAEFMLHNSASHDHWPYSWVCVGLSLCLVHYNTINRPIFFNLQLFVSKSKNRVSSPWVVVRQLQPCAIRVYLCWFILWFLWWVIVVVEKYSAMEVKIQKEEDEIRARRDARLAREKAAANKGNILLHYNSYCTVRKENTEQ